MIKQRKSCINNNNSVTIYKIIKSVYIQNQRNMSYLSRMQLQEPLRNSQKVNKLQIPSTSYLKSFKKTISCNANKSKCDINHHSFGDENARPNLKLKQKQLQEKNSQFDQLQYVMQQTDHSMQELLNSSINQFEKLIMHQDLSESLQQQNYRLKNALSKMKNILRDKLQTALQKQKQQLSKMLQDYISLITKLLKDKQQLTIKLQDISQDNQKKIKQIQMECNKKLKIMNQQREYQIGSTKNQIQQFLAIIQQYQEEAKQQQTKFNEMQETIERLEKEKQNLALQLNKFTSIQQTNQNETCLRAQAQSSKIQTLLELLQKNQQQNNQLKQQIVQLKSKQNTSRLNNEINQLKQVYERKLNQLEQEHIQQFLQYQKAIKDTLFNKDQCIQRLNIIIESLKQRKISH